MMDMNLQLFGGRGSSSSGGTGGGATGGISESDIVSRTSLISEREGSQVLVDETMDVFKDVFDEYGTIVDDIQLATLKGAGMSALAFYDGSNIAVNKAFFNENMTKAYDACVKSGFHPSKGNKTAMQAVVAHELGHKLTADVGVKMGKNGWTDFDSIASSIMKEAKKGTKHRKNSDLAKKISGYAKESNAEAIAEAFADVFCNGKKAKSESKAVVNVINKYLK